jgi:hypothetical protein
VSALALVESVLGPDASQVCVDHTGLAGGRQTQAEQYPYGMPARAEEVGWHPSVGPGGNLSGFGGGGMGPQGNLSEFGRGGMGPQRFPEGGNSKRQRLA